MKKTLSRIGIAVFSLVFLAGTGMAFAQFHSPNYKSIIEKNLSEAAVAKEAAQSTSCELIGELTSKCYKHNAKACSDLETEEAQYQVNFQMGSFESCFQETASSSSFPSDPNQPLPLNVDPSSDPSNPLFRGDESSRS